jgi:hypothetical protein
MNEIRIVPARDEHVEGFNRCVDAVARERRYLGMLEAPPLDAWRAFVTSVLERGGVCLVALDAAGEVVGWCDIQRRGRRDSGTSARWASGCCRRRAAPGWAGG